MRVPETQAHKMFCPFARIVSARLNEGGGYTTRDGAAGFNVAQIERDGEQIAMGQCQGIACMAWRTVASETREVRSKLVGLERVTTETVVERIGVCGLAGPASPSELPQPEASS